MSQLPPRSVVGALSAALALYGVLEFEDKSIGVEAVLAILLRHAVTLNLGSGLLLNGAIQSKLNTFAELAQTMPIHPVWIHGIAPDIELSSVLADTATFNLLAGMGISS